ncbi:hypothetical protein KGQ19_37930 [Catenulispora sp. NL8]|uniref:Uncharacterized protein n=1 Tax=Catenulispora pinistramenti TaxID=2705254 RepID=A0ABS5L2U6_9ACTN|nr:hypothetical protein [Catenulispora pinistramenti]MBS2552652.1 hypothetical protein [Catenulispora pinistramenti]
MRSADGDNYRPSDWQPLADTDPTPGDLGEIADLGAWSGTLADRLDATADQLGQTCVDEFWNSAAGLEFKHLVDSVAARCRQAAYRFRTAADTYGTTTGTGYAVALAGFQSAAGKSLLKAQVARDDITNLARTNPLLNPPGPIMTAYVTNHLTPDVAEETQAVPGVSDLGLELRQARVALDHVIADRDAAASQAAAKLDYLATATGISDAGPALQAGETVQTRLDAYNDAQQLTWALAHPDDPQAKAIVTRVAADLDRRANDPGFVTDVVNQSGASLGGIASLLRGNPPPPMPSDHTRPLDAASQTTLAAFGAALAATVKSDSLSPTAFTQLTSSKDAWSTAMLLQYGPDGAAYGDDQGKLLLATLARNLTDSLINNKDANGLIFPPGQDAFAAVLNRVSENPGAVRLALGDGTPAASQFAMNLAAIGMAVPAQHLNQDLAAQQAAVAKFLLSCGIPPDRTDMTAMQGTLNIMTSFIDYQQANGGSAGGPVQKALQSYTVNYMADLSQVLGTSDRGLSLAPPPTVKIGQDDLTNLLKLAYPDANSIGSYKATVAQQVVAALAAYGKDPQAQPLYDYHHLSSLYGAVNTVEGDLVTDAASAQDADAADRLLVVNILAGGYGNEHLDSTSSNYGQPIAGLLGPVLPSWFDTGHVQKAQADLHEQYVGEERTMEIMLLQAYVDSGRATDADLASLAPVLENGNVQGNLDFDKVWGASEDRFTLGGEKLSGLETDMLGRFGWQKGQ